MIRSTAMTVGAAACMVVAAGGFAWSISGRDAGSFGTWLGGAAIAGLSGGGAVYLVGRSHEAARNERRTR
jgi:hypothetical protein